MLHNCVFAVNKNTQKLEHSKAKLASQEKFKGRLIRFTLASVLIFLISLSIGILGYHFIAKLEWIDAFLNASMILGGMGPVAELFDPWAKFLPVVIHYSAVWHLFPEWQCF